MPDQPDYEAIAKELEAESGGVIDYLDRAAAALRHAAEIIGKLPVTADGVPVGRQDRVWWPGDLSRSYYPDECCVPACYSTREEAEAARTPTEASDGV